MSGRRNQGRKSAHDPPRRQAPAVRHPQRGEQALTRAQGPRTEAVQRVMRESSRAEAERVHRLEELIHDQSGNITGFFLDPGRARRLNPNGGHAPVCTLPTGRQIVPHPSNRHEFEFRPPIPAREGAEFEKLVMEMLQSLATGQGVGDVVDAARGSSANEPARATQTAYVTYRLPARGRYLGRFRMLTKRSRTSQTRPAGRAGASSAAAGTTQAAAGQSEGPHLPPRTIAERDAWEGVGRHSLGSRPAASGGSPQPSRREHTDSPRGSVTHRAASDSPPRQQRGGNGHPAQLAQGGSRLTNK